MAVGRLPASSSGELGAMVNNIINYESNPFMGQTNWFERAWCASHTDDVPSNPSTKEYTRQIMLQHGLDSVYWNVFVDFMSTPILEQRIEAGVCVFNDRMSWVGEFVNSQLSGIQNGQMLPFVLVITCGTGTFSIDDALSEEWVRLGTIGTPRGAIGAIGMSGTSTHARYNNIIDGGAMQTLFALDIREQGMSLVGAKLELFKNYWDVAGGAYQLDSDVYG
jgi:hypothetical protein